MSIVLYHGSIHLFDLIDVRYGRGYKDFGKGFYTTREVKHAISIAERGMRYQNTDRSYVYKYEISKEDYNNLRGKRFNTSSLAWLDFVVSNRQSKYSKHSYDVVSGPTADDGTRLVINNYLNGVYGAVGSAVAKRMAIQLLKVDVLPTQTFFGNNEAVSKLKLSGRREIRR